MGIWRRIEKPEFGFLNNFSDSLALLEEKYTGLLADVSDDALWIVSDYSGQHRQAKYEAYSFLVSTAQAIASWEGDRQTVRSQFLKDGRHLSYKKLSEPVRSRALMPFLAAANRLGGNLVTILVDKRIPSLFKESGRVEPSDLPEIFPAAVASSTVEKSLRVGAFLSLLVAGFRNERQKAIWISDRDEVLEDHDRRERFAEFVSHFTRSLTGWTNPAPLSFGTSELDAHDHQLEDLLSIPDLAAGALSSVASLTLTSQVDGLSTKFVSSTSAENSKTRLIVNWLGGVQHPLRRVILRAETGPQNGIRALAQVIRSVQ